MLEWFTPALGDHRQRQPVAATLRNEFLDGLPDRGEDRRTTATGPPALLQDLFGLHSGLLNGATGFVLPEAGAVAGFLLGRFAPRRTTVIGGVSILTGTALIAGGVAAGVLPLLWLGGLIGGVGFGASFSGALRAITPLVEMHQRAGLFAAGYLVAYLSFGV